MKTWISGGIFEWLIRSISRNWESWNLSRVWFSSRSWVSFVVGMTVQARECIKLNQPFKQGIHWVYVCFLPWLIVDDKLVLVDKHKIRRNESRLNQERLTTPNILISAKTSSNLSNFSSTSHKIFKTSKSHYMEKLWYFHFVWIPDFKGSLMSSVIAIFFLSFLQLLILQTDMSNHFHNNPQKIFYFQFLPINHSVFTHQTESPQEIWKILLSQKIHNLWRLRALTLKE